MAFFLFCYSKYMNKINKIAPKVMLTSGIIAIVFVISLVIYYWWTIALADQRTPYVENKGIVSEEILGEDEDLKPQGLIPGIPPPKPTPTPPPPEIKKATAPPPEDDPEPPWTTGPSDPPSEDPVSPPGGTPWGSGPSN